MGAFTDLFGYIPRVQVLEAFAENPSDTLSAPEIERMTDVSRRAAYLIIRHYVDSGVLVPAGPENQLPRKFMLNPNDLRSQTVLGMERLITLGSIQSEIKRWARVSQQARLPPGLISRIPSVVIYVGFSTVTPTSGSSGTLSGTTTAQGPISSSMLSSLPAPPSSSSEVEYPPDPTS